MKRVFSLCLGMIILFISIFIIKDTRIYCQNKVQLILFFSRVFVIAFSICGVIIIQPTCNYTINNRVNFIAVCMSLISCILALELVYTFNLLPVKPDRVKGALFAWEALYVASISTHRFVNSTEDYPEYNYRDIISVIFILTLGVQCLDIVHLRKFIIEYAFWGKLGLTLGYMIVSIHSLYRLDWGRKPIKSKEEEIIVWVIIGHCIFSVIKMIEVFISSELINNIGYIVSASMVLLLLGYICNSVISTIWRQFDAAADDKRKEADRLNVDQQTLITVSKDINLKINAIKSKLSKIQEGEEFSDDSNIKDYISKINNNCNRLIKLSDSMLEFTKYESGHQKLDLKNTDLTLLIGDIIKYMEPYVLKKGLTIEYSFSKHHIMGFVDPDAIERIIVNLLSNAIKYNTESGSIKVYLNDKHENIYIAIRDKGIGIPAESIDTIFDKFSRANLEKTHREEGSGLGLPIVKTLVEMHYGKISVVSRVGEGTIFSLILPKKYSESNI